MTQGDTTKREIDASSWSDTEELEESWYFVKRRGVHPPTVRFVNDLDVEVTIVVNFTDGFDKNYNRTDQANFYQNSKTIGWPVLGGNPGSQSKVTSITLSAGSVESYTIAPVWDFFVVGVTPTTSPSSGSMKIITMK